MHSLRGLGLRVQGLRFRIQGLGFRVRVWGSPPFPKLGLAQQSVCKIIGEQLGIPLCGSEPVSMVALLARSKTVTMYVNAA